jgi:prepilin-type processing-associated H-X9-DG protein
LEQEGGWGGNHTAVKPAGGNILFMDGHVEGLSAHAAGAPDEGVLSNERWTDMGGDVAEWEDDAAW